MACALLCGVLAAASAQARDYAAGSEGELTAVLRAAGAGDRIVLAKGEWKDLQFVIRNSGREGQPLVITAQTPGGTVLMGQSSVRVAGSHVVLANLVFRDGYSPSSAVINIRGMGGDTPSDVRISNIVIEDFSKPDAGQKDYWLSLTGHGHRIDHNAFVGKTNAGPTLVVRLDQDGGAPNRHRIEYNYFGPRQPLGANGAETIRVGTSSVVDEVSATRIYRNLFERTNGEPEVISLKSRENMVEENTFYEVSGALTFRHGGRNTARRNVFVGNGRKGTGGIRLTGAGHVVSQNYFEGLAGTGYLSALTLMSGEADASSSGYRAVDGTVIEGNSFFDSGQIAFGAGHGDGRPVAPSKVAVNGNLFAGTVATRLREYAPLGGISFAGNVAGRGTRLPAGFGARQDLVLRRSANGLLYAYRDKKRVDAGVPFDMKPVTWGEVGPTWYQKPDPSGPPSRAGG